MNRREWIWLALSFCVSFTATILAYVIAVSV